MMFVLFFFFNDTATTEIYTLSLHDALPIYAPGLHGEGRLLAWHLHDDVELARIVVHEDRKSTRLNSSHANISYAVFCLKKKKTKIYKNNSKQIICIVRKHLYIMNSIYIH